MNVESPLLQPAPEGPARALGNRFSSALAVTSDTNPTKLVLGLALILSALAAIYWMAFASDRYVSQANVVVQRAQAPGIGSADLGAFLSGGSSPGVRGDQMLLRDHMLSLDMLKKLDAKLHLRTHYSDHKRDFLSRASSEKMPMERFRDYFLGCVKIDYDDYDGVLEMRVEAFDPVTAQAIVVEMLREGEAFMNDSDHKLADVQVEFLEDALKHTAKRNQDAREAVIAFQNKAGMVSPEDDLRFAANTIAQLEARKTSLQVNLGSLQSYLVADHPDVVSVRQQIASIDEQIRLKREKATAPGGEALNRSTEKFQRLQQEAAFTQGLYQTTMAALEKGRIEAARSVKKISILQTPTLPEYAERPRRAYNALVFALIALIVAGISLLLVSIVRDHFD
jgi:capsular polysaccharide transport system permease protein